MKQHIFKKNVQVLVLVISVLWIHLGEKMFFPKMYISLFITEKTWKQTVCPRIVKLSSN